MVSHEQLAARGYSDHAIQHRLETGRLHRVYRGVYAVGRPELTQTGRWMAAVLAGGDGAVLSHHSAAALWKLRKTPRQRVPIHISIPLASDRSQPGIVVHRRRALSAGDVTTKDCIPVTTPTGTLIDLAASLNERQLEAAINEAANCDLTDPDSLAAAVAETAPRPGRGALRKLLAKHAFSLTDSELERMFLRITRRASLPDPLTQQWVGGYRVDFYWPELGLVVEADSLRFHRTPAQQLADRRRDQAHTVAGLTPLRFTHYQVARDARYVEATLVAVARR